MRTSESFRCANNLLLIRKLSITKLSLTCVDCTDSYRLASSNGLEHEAGGGVLADALKGRSAEQIGNNKENGPSTDINTQILSSL